MHKSLNELTLNEYAIINQINVDENIKRRLLDIGIIPGTKIKAIFKSPKKDPMAYLVRNTVIALRNKDAKGIEVIVDG